MHSQPPICTPNDPAKPPALLVVELASDLQEGRYPDPAAVALFAAGVEAWLDHGLPLEVALNLRGEVGREVGRSSLKRRQRDQHLRQAAHMCPGESPWKQAVALRQEINIFLSRLWPSWRHHDAPPPGASALRSHLFHAARAGRLPGSASQIHTITTMKP